MMRESGVEVGNRMKKARRGILSAAECAGEEQRESPADERAKPLPKKIYGGDAFLPNAAMSA